jgi:AmmeMemoRadiSam system protein A
MINEVDQKELLLLARQALEARVTGGRAPVVVCTGPFALRCGAFVSIHSGEHLRGCLGRLTADSPLGRTLAHLGAAVADSDSRFPAVSPFELPFLQIEISLLSPERPIASIDEIEIGRHGLIVEQSRARGVLLPQVATDHEWDRETFLDHTCVKAGLPRDAWRAGAHILVFDAFIFSEHAAAMLD